MKFIIRLLVSAIVVVLLSYFLPGAYVESFLTAIIVALILSLLNLFVRPILIIFTLPVTLVTFGLFLLVINAIIILLADALIEGFSVNGFWIALIFSLLLSTIQALLFSFLPDD
ncbi:MAG TPA: phage holin family protein [Salinimicrobium sp.]|nr:phage holin family protein [Salinimicrobium sp.]